MQIATGGMASASATRSGDGGLLCFKQAANKHPQSVPLHMEQRCRGGGGAGTGAGAVPSG